MDNLAVPFTTGFTLIVDIILAGFTLEIFRRAGLSRKLRLTMLLVMIAVLSFLLWGVVSHSLFPPDISGTTFFVCLMGTVALVTGAFAFIPALRHALLNTPQEILLLPQGLRVFLGAGFLAAASLHLMPVSFGIADGMTHIAAGFLALKTGLLWGRGEQNGRELWFANLFGLLDIVTVALGLSFVLLPVLTPSHNIMLAAFFAAPLFVGLHVMSLAKAVGAMACKAGAE